MFDAIDCTVDTGLVAGPLVAGPLVAGNVRGETALPAGEVVKIVGGDTVGNVGQSSIGVFYDRLAPHSAGVG